MAVTLRVLGTQATLGNLLGTYEGRRTGLSSKVIAMEHAQAEGTLLQLAISINTPAGAFKDTTTQYYANTINEAFLAGHITAPGSTTTIEPWPTQTTTIATVHQKDVLVLRWVKNPIWSDILIGILIAVAADLAYKYLTKSRYTLSGSTTRSQGGGGASGPYKILGVAWYWWAGGAVALGVPTGYAYDAWLRRNRLGALQSGQKIRAIQRAEEAE